jgi:hypothetical protein
MPYEVKKEGSGYKVFHKGTSKNFSNQPLPKSRAMAQMRAMYANEKKENGGRG